MNDCDKCEGLIQELDAVYAQLDLEKKRCAILAQVVKLLQSRVLMTPHLDRLIKQANG